MKILKALALYIGKIIVIIAFSIALFTVPFTALAYSTKYDGTKFYIEKGDTDFVVVYTVIEVLLATLLTLLGIILL